MSRDFKLPQKRPDAEVKNFADRLRDKFTRETVTIPGVDMPRNEDDRIIRPEYFTVQDIQDRVFGLISAPEKQLSETQLRATGLVDDPLLAAKPHRTRSLEEKQQIAKAWVEMLVDRYRKEGKIMTDRQMQDYTMGNKWKVGDKAHYIGETRTERVTGSDGVDYLVVRKQGQTGAISAIAEDKAKNRIVTFFPDARVQPEKSPQAESMLVQLEFLEHALGWLNVERTD